jgi:hypothetical protein
MTFSRIFAYFFTKLVLIKKHASPLLIRMRTIVSGSLPLNQVLNVCLFEAVGASQRVAQVVALRQLWVLPQGCLDAARARGLPEGIKASWLVEEGSLHQTVC